MASYHVCMVCHHHYVREHNIWRVICLYDKSPPLRKGNIIYGELYVCMVCHHHYVRGT